VARAMTWVFVTGNANKHREAEAILGRPLACTPLELPELQAATTREVALAKATAAFALLSRPVIVEDAGFELTGLGGFPGPFIKYWEQLGGLASICKTADGLVDRGAVAVCVLGLCDASGARVVEGRIRGTLAREPRGANGFGWDAIFIPDGHDRTFGEMTAAEKSAISHRRRAWDALRDGGSD
jgi:non-canonical purine NTP pyrophosphatase (RdgB/HAM1 family)